jgi:hypothetical protein
MFRLNKKDLALYWLEKIGFLGFTLCGLCIAYFVVMLVAVHPVHPASLPKAVVLFNYFVGLGMFVGVFFGFLAFSILDGKDKGRYELVRGWGKVTHFRISLFPRDSQEAEGMAPYLRVVLVGYATLAEDAFSERDEARSALDAMRIRELTKPADLVFQRRARAKARRAFEKAERKAERRHKEYLAAWDYLTKDEDDSGVGLLANLRGSDPEYFRRTMHAIG